MVMILNHRLIAYFPKELTWDDLRAIYSVNLTAIAFDGDQRQVFRFESLDQLVDAVDELIKRDPKSYPDAHIEAALSSEPLFAFHHSPSP
jgi:hypothetical protein